MNNINNNKKDVEDETEFDCLNNMMNEYSMLNIEDKQRYLNRLTGWYMREKDILNLIYINSKHGDHI